MKKLFAIAALTLLASTAWADQNSQGPYEMVRQHSQGSQMMGEVNCGHTHLMGSSIDNSEVLTPIDGE